MSYSHNSIIFRLTNGDAPACDEAPAVKGGLQESKEELTLPAFPY